MNKRMKEFYKMRNRLPRNARQFVVADQKDLDSLNDEEFIYLLEFEYNNAMNNYSSERDDALNFMVSSAFQPNRPSFEGVPVPGSDHFDSVPETYESEPLTFIEQIDKIYKYTDSNKDFKAKALELWFEGYFDDSINYDGFLKYLDGYIVIQRNRTKDLNYDTKKVRARDK